MPFHIQALDHRQFASLFDMSEKELAVKLAVRRTVSQEPGFPCRVSLADATIGEQVILLNYQHQGAASPYRAAHAIFVREGARTAELEIGEVPPVFHKRALSLRAFDRDGMIVAADLVADGKDLAPALETLVDLAETAEVHIHFAKFGCYAARAIRA